MAGGLTASIYVDMNGNITQMVTRYNQNMRQLGQNTQNQAGLMSRSLSGVQSSFAKLNNTFVKLAAGGALIGMVKQVGRTESALTRIKTSFQLTALEIKNSKNEMRAAANEFNVVENEVAKGVSTLMAKGPDYAFVQKNIRNLTMATQGFGVTTTEAGDALASMYSKGLDTPNKIKKGLDTLMSHLAFGPIDLGEMIRLMPGLLALNERKGNDVYTETSALIQGIAVKFNSPSEAATAIARFNSALTSMSQEDRDFFKTKGLEIDDKDGNRRPLIDLGQEFLTITEGNITKLSADFNDLALRFLVAIKDKDVVKNTRKMMDPDNIIEGSTEASAKENANTFDSAITKLSNVVTQFANINLAEPIKKLAEMIGKFSMADIDKWAKAGGEIVAGLAALVVAYKGVQWGKSIVDSFKTVAVDALGGGDMQVVPVFVMNPGFLTKYGGLPPVPPPAGAPAAGAGAGGAGNPPTRGAKIKGLLKSNAVPILSTALTAIQMAQTEARTDIDRSQKNVIQGGNLGMWGGSIAGWKIGQEASNGLVHPGLKFGVQAGSALMGGLAGSDIGSYVVDGVQSYFDQKQTAEQKGLRDFYLSTLSPEEKDKHLQGVAANEKYYNDYAAATIFDYRNNPNAGHPVGLPRQEPYNDPTRAPNFKKQYQKAKGDAELAALGAELRLAFSPDIPQKNNTNNTNNHAAWTQATVDAINASAAAIATIQNQKPPEGTINVNIKTDANTTANTSTNANGINIKTNVGNAGDLP